MRFSVFALATVPDTETSRRLFDLADLDDQAVAKVLYHRRKQQTGVSEDLRWDQRAIAGITLIQHSVDKLQIDTMTPASHREPEMLEAFYKAALRDGRMVCWNGVRSDIPLVHFRSLCHAIAFPAYWQTIKDRNDFHVDILEWLSPPGNDRPGFDETARRLGAPGMLGRTADSMIEAWWEGRHGEIQAYSELAALNLYLLALRLFGITGQVTRHDGARALGSLRTMLARRDEDHLKAFASAWEG